MSLHRTLYGFVPLALLLALTLPVSPDGPSDRVAPPAPNLVDHPLELTGEFVSGGCGVCRCCNGGCGALHSYLAQPSPFTTPVTSCPNGCDGSCSYGFASSDLERLWEAVRESDVDVIKDLLTSQPAFVQFNSDRAALQVASCNGEGLAANIPLATALVGELLLD